MSFQAMAVEVFEMIWEEAPTPRAAAPGGLWLLV